MMHMHDAIPSACACTALRKASRAITRIYDAGLAAHGLTTCQFALLRHIGRAGEIALSRLADALVMDRTTLYRVVRPAEAAGWVVTCAAGTGRVRLARLTPQGMALIARAEPDWIGCQATVRAHLGEPGWAALHGAALAVQALDARAAIAGVAA